MGPPTIPSCVLSQFLWYNSYIKIHNRAVYLKFFSAKNIPSKYLLVFRTSWRRLQHVFSVTILCLPRRLEDVLQKRLEDVLKTYWRHLARRLEEVLEDETLLRWRRLEDVLKTYLEDVLKTCLEDALKALWKETKYLLGISVSNKSKCVSNKSIFHKSISDNS